MIFTIHVKYKDFILKNNKECFKLKLQEKLEQANTNQIKSYTTHVKAKRIKTSM